MPKQDSSFSLGYDLESDFHNVRDNSDTLLSESPTVTEFNMENSLFEDPRSSTDRRRNSDPSKIPAAGCRRKMERRKMVYLKGDSWWIKRNYNNNPE